jgi:hypothetical protein
MKFLIFISPFIPFLIGMYIYKYRQTLRLVSQDFNWYTDNGSNFVRDGKAVCFKCKSTDVWPERVIGPSDIRRHSCRDCGRGLYYSRVEATTPAQGALSPSADNAAG